MTDQPNDDRIPMVFAPNSEEGAKGSDAWFWPDLTGQGPEDEPGAFPMVLQLGVWRGELTLEQARYLRDLRGYDWWANIDFRVIRQYLAEQADAGGASAGGGPANGD